MKNTYSIGRSEMNDFITPTQKKYSDIGREHAQFLLNSEGGVDIVAKKKGYAVLVNGFKVFRKRITAQDSLQLGRAYQFQLGHYFKLDRAGVIIGKRTNPNDYVEEFDALNNNWRANIQAEKNLKGPLNVNLKITDFLLVFGVMGAMSIWMPQGTSLIFLVLLPLLKGNNGKKLKALKKQMEQEHFCPKCKHYFKDTTWESIKALGGHQCGAKWS